MDLFLLLWLVGRVFSIFLNFTFTDLEDFMPLFTLIIGIILAFRLNASPQKPASAALIASMLLLSLWPILPNSSLFFMARELQSVHGAWPQVMADDPKLWLGAVSPHYDALFHLTGYLEAFAGAWMVLFLTLFFALKPRFLPVWRRVFIGLCGFSLLVFLFDPGALFAWWLD